MIELREISKTIGGESLFDKLNLKLEQGSVTGIAGENGSGKTTLLNIISGMVVPDSGDVLLKNLSVSSKSTRFRAELGLGRVFQHTRIFRYMSVLDNLLASVRSHPGESLLNCLIRLQKVKDFENTSRKMAMEILSHIQLTNKLNDKAVTLSFGQQRLLSLGMSLMNNPDILLLDEPFSGLSPVITEQMKKAIHQISNYNKTILIIEHNKEILAELCSDLFLLREGKLEPVHYDNSKIVV
jgi:ABC-type branched-subunit amino acid transport system ATPase component